MLSRLFLTVCITFFFTACSKENTVAKEPDSVTPKPDIYLGTIIQIDSSRVSNDVILWEFLSITNSTNDTIKTSYFEDSPFDSTIPGLVGDTIEYGLGIRTVSTSSGSRNSIRAYWYIPNSTFQAKAWYRKSNLTLSCAIGTVTDAQFKESINDSIASYRLDYSLVCGDTLSELLLVNSNQYSPSDLKNQDVYWDLLFSQNEGLGWEKVFPNL